MRFDTPVLFSLFRYTVYALLSINVYLFFAEEYQAALTQFADGIALADFIEAFAATVDTAAWVVLLLLFELETRVLDDSAFTPRVTWSLRILRAVCYAVIIYAFYGYVVNLAFTYETSVLAGVSNLCALPGDGWSWSVTLDEFAGITATNCASWSDATQFYRFDGLNAAVDTTTLADIRWLAWVDVINGAVWIVVVILLEVDVWLQEHNRYEGTAFFVSTALKFVLYGTLCLAVLFWMWKGDFTDWWDALLWLIAFVFIELNVFEWRAETHEEAAEGMQG
ncbi:MAG: hypothetical protein V2I25_11970 [Woeseiaceae bacterium]|nr:hypothetical protein [Woeseiaceae bacterium]